MNRRAKISFLALAGGLLAVSSGGGCGDEAVAPEMMLLVAGSWNEDPSSIAEIGYQVAVDIGWPSRAQTCSPLSPSLRVTVNDREAGPIVAGACEWDFLVKVRPVDATVPVVVRLHDGGRLLGEATYEHLFPGTGAALVSPAEPRVGVDEPFVVSVPPGIQPHPELTRLQFYWQDTPATVPPYYTYVLAQVTEGATLTTKAPPRTGRGLAMFITSSPRDYSSAESCTGFTTCEALADANALGPIPLDVIPDAAQRTSIE